MQSNRKLAKRKDWFPVIGTIQTRCHHAKNV